MRNRSTGSDLPSFIRCSGSSLKGGVIGRISLPTKTIPSQSAAIRSPLTCVATAVISLSNKRLVVVPSLLRACSRQAVISTQCRLLRTLSHNGPSPRLERGAPETTPTLLLKLWFSEPTALPLQSRQCSIGRECRCRTRSATVNSASIAPTAPHGATAQLPGHPWLQQANEMRVSAPLMSVPIGSR
jgi:hypothetical protein